MNTPDLKQFMDKVKAAEKGHGLDLSIGEDLSMAIMNLISLEEHMFFNGNKTGKTKYFELLNEIREMRKVLMKEIVKNPEAEIWCTSKHLLATSMRLFEVGTKYQTKGESTKAHDYFQKSYHLYNLFWGLNLNLVKPGKEIAIEPVLEEKDSEVMPNAKGGLMGKLSSTIGHILDCCRE
ncbi:MAG: hypothetical protein WCT01_02260 [Candidatus Shapirobacteria bacterium]|jgi:hypothetical protein